MPYVVLLLCLLISACQLKATRSSAHASQVTAPDSVIQKVKAEGWLEKDCNVSRRLMNHQQFKDCVLVDAALLKPFDPSRADEFGKDYDPQKYYTCRKDRVTSRGDVSCHIYKLVRDEPEPVWPYPDVPPVKWPEAPEKSVYYPGISREDYFRALCESESGEFIYKTVKGVEGVYQIRPQYPERSMYMRDPYVMEDPYGFDVIE